MKVIPTASTRGYAKTPAERMDTAIVYYMQLGTVSTLRYAGSIRTIQTAIQRAGIGPDNISQIATNVQGDLQVILKNIFDSATVEVTYEQKEPDGATYVLVISATVVDDGVSYDLSKNVTVDTARFSKIYL